ncbi:MAG: OmpA family protein [Alphaproteobacteria bacterium]
MLTQAAQAFADLDNRDACRKALAEAQRVLDAPRPTPAPAPTVAGRPEQPTSPQAVPPEPGSAATASAPAETAPRSEPPPAEAPLPAATAVYFAVGAASLDQAARRTLAPLAEQAARDGLGVRLRGFTDATGSRELNLTLSRKRVESVATAFAAERVPAARIEKDWFGIDPAAPDSGDPEAGRKSRRVEIELVR